MRSARALHGTVILLSLCALVAPSGAPTDPLPAYAKPELLDLDGHRINPFAPSGPANVLFFVATDCPVSNSYAPEIQSICRDYKGRGVSCALMYEDVDLELSTSHLDAQIRRHLQEYRYSDMSVAVDRDRIAAKRVKAAVTPGAAVVDHSGKVRYRGRIDNFYAALGRTRRQVTEHDLRDALDALLSGRSIPKAETEAVGCYIVDPSLLRK